MALKRLAMRRHQLFPNYRILVKHVRERELQNQRRLKELELKYEQQLAREKSHEDFVHMAVHELKSPVTVLKAYLQMMGMKLTREEQRTLLSTIEKMDVQLDRITHLISDLLDGTRAGLGTLHCLMNDFDINESARICIASLKAAHTDFVVELETDPSEPVAYGDRERIEQVMNNLLTNAVKYSPGEKYVKLQTRLGEGQIVVTVTDHGMGIPEHKQRLVFDQFYRVDTGGGKKVPGLGLGLFICADIIRKHNGRIGVSSREGEGSAFWFSLPYRG